MEISHDADEAQRVLTFWWLLELFSPQKVPNLTRSSTRPADRQVIEFDPSRPLPWAALKPLPPLGSTPLVWRHTIYLGVYALDATYETLHRTFGADDEAYDERPSGRSACAGVMVDQQGRLIAGTAVLSSAAWAVGRLSQQGATDPAALEGFESALEAFDKAVDEYVGARRDDSEGDHDEDGNGDGDQDQSLPLDASSLSGLIRLAQTVAGISGLDGVATDRITIESVAVSAHRLEEAADIDFLNSYYLDDLRSVRQEVARGNAGAALTAYLTGQNAVDEQKRIDVVAAPRVVDDGVRAARLPKGRWPSRPEHPLALSQQFAVNQALNDLAPAGGLLGVNGPPGTGKTTMLRDILAGNVVERARRLAALTRAEDAFTDTTHRWNGADGHHRAVRQLRPELTGFEMIVASANNAAVENISVEIPTRKAIEEPWRDTADYFSDLGTAILAETSDGGARSGEADEAGEAHEAAGAWGLVAARLGKKSNRAAFHSAFWFDKKVRGNDARGGESVPRMQTRLLQWRDGTAPVTPWKQASKRFTAAEEIVDGLLRERRLAEARHDHLREADETHRRLQQERVDALAAHDAAEQVLADHGSDEQIVENERIALLPHYERQMTARPGVMEIIVSLGRAARDWRAEVAPVAEQLRSVESRQRELASRGEELREAARRAANDVTRSEEQLDLAGRELASMRHQCDRDALRFGPAYPGSAESDAARELRAPWLDAELDRARSDLFLAALRLHQDFLANTARDMLNGLRAAGEIVAGNLPNALEPEKVRAAWQLFFLVVPLVSTTFASADRMLRGVGRESIGWLFIDEAGQAAPQYAAGSIWRARRVVAVGDPLQLPPVTTIPPKAKYALAKPYGIGATWMPPEASVQTLADRVAIHGTTLTQAGHRVWVSAPLRVHRRCDDPMFTLCNQIAYNGIMVNGVHRAADDPGHPDPFSPSRIAASHWVDEPATMPGSHYQPAQIDRVKRAIAYLQERGVAASDIIAISPFRDVAAQLEGLQRTYPRLKAGTIHTAQGREAPVVILVLGGDPAKPGAKAWAASTVNLVNVAASRAQRRLYVVGDRTEWARYNYFAQLSTALTPTESEEGR